MAPAEIRLKRNRAWAFAIALVVFVFDQAMKWLVIAPLNLRGQPEQTITITSFFNLHWVENRGVSLGLFSAGSETGRWALVALTAAIAIFVAVWMWRERSRDDSVALALILGGALGNVIDRLRFGYVVDFLDLHAFGWHWPAFNVADSAITVGAALVILDGFLRQEPSSPARDSAGGGVRK